MAKAFGKHLFYGCNFYLFFISMDFPNLFALGYAERFICIPYLLLCCYNNGESMKKFLHRRVV
ncbi:MAG: hypothetical protein C0392_05665 [Syntrophus sp. (in: bacteria)]|nr:hypothetical protein [Syntrophus sp. (in: bacteria)]